MKPRGKEKEIVIEKVVLIAVLSSLACVGRVLFVAIPNVQATSFVIIMTGLCFGKEIGGMTGLVGAMASSLMLGIGPWTPWQVGLWGCMGWSSGIFSPILQKYKGLLYCYGIGWGFLFGWVMNLWYLFGSEGNQRFYIYGMACIASFFYDLAHGVSNSILLLFFYDSFMKMLGRIRNKYF